MSSKARSKSTKPRARKTTPAAPEADAAPGSEALRRLDPAQRRAQILAAAEALFAERPYAELSVQDVAEAAGITPGLVYHYFESKEGLLSATLEMASGKLLQACLPDPALPVPQQFEVGVKGYLDYVLEHRTAYWNLFRGPAAHEPDLQRISEGTRKAIVEHALSVLGLPADGAPATRLSFRGYIGYVESVILDWLEHESVPRATLERLIFTIVLAALTAGFANDPQLRLSAVQRARFEQDYRRHFQLPGA